MADESLSGTTCRLIREDGTEWIVTRFDLREGGAWITARRVPEGSSPGGNGNGHSGAHGQPGDPDGAERLLEAPLRHGDRLVWTRRDGTVAWAMRNPTGVGIAWRHQDVEDDEFFAGDFR
jgi:hypothetical protein